MFSVLAFQELQVLSSWCVSSVMFLHPSRWPDQTVLVPDSQPVFIRCWNLFLRVCITAHSSSVSQLVRSQTPSGHQSDILALSAEVKQILFQILLHSRSFILFQVISCSESETHVHSRCLKLRRAVHASAFRSGIFPCGHSCVITDTWLTSCC